MQKMSAVKIEKRSWRGGGAKGAGKTRLTLIVRVVRIVRVALLSRVLADGILVVLVVLAVVSNLEVVVLDVGEGGSDRGGDPALGDLEL